MSRSFFYLLASLLFCYVAPGNTKPGPNPPGPTPDPPPPCYGHLTRTADKTITMVANKAFYKSTLDAQAIAPTTTSSPNSPAIAAIGGGCKRWVVEIIVPANASSGCPDCYEWAEILIGADQFTNSSSFEEHFYHPKSSTNKTLCESYRHQVAVYRKAATTTVYPYKPVKLFDYRGRYENNMCRVYALNLGTVHDTTEVYGSIIIPTSGTDHYRVVHLLEYDGQLLDTVAVVEFEEMNTNNLRQKQPQPAKIKRAVPLERSLPAPK